MKIDIIEKKDNPFLKRTDLILTIDHTGSATPKKDDLIKEIAGKFSSTPENVTIDYIFSEYGLSRAKVKAKVWKEKPPEKKVKKEEKPKEEVKPVEKKEEPKAEKEVKEKEEKPAEKKEEKQLEKKEGEKK